MTTTDEFKVIIVARFTSSDWERSELKSETQFPRMCSFALQYFPSLGRYSPWAISQCSRRVYWYKHVWIGCVLDLRTLRSTEIWREIIAPDSAQELEAKANLPALSLAVREASHAEDPLAKAEVLVAFLHAALLLTYLRHVYVMFMAYISLSEPLPHFLLHLLFS